MQHELPTRPVTAEHGRFAAPTGPGLGVEVRQDVLERYRVRS